MADAIPSLVAACLLLAYAVDLTVEPSPALFWSPLASVKWIDGFQLDLPYDLWLCEPMYKDEDGRGGDILGEPAGGELDVFGDGSRAMVEETMTGFWSRATGVGTGTSPLDSHIGLGVRGSGSAVLALSSVTLAMNDDVGLWLKDEDGGGCGDLQSLYAGGVINWSGPLGRGVCCSGVEQVGVVGEREQGGVPFTTT